jgi:hypothetical protein
MARTTTVRITERTVPLMLSQHITPIDHNGDINKEVMDVVAAQGDLLNCFMRSHEGSAAGSYESISNAAQRLLVEAEDLAHKVYGSEMTATKLRMVRVTDKSVHIQADTVLDIHNFLKGQGNEDGVQH